jgi:hypothetical protein
MERAVPLKSQGRALADFTREDGMNGVKPEREAET